MVLPLIPLAIVVATTVSGAGGGAAGIWGGAQIKKARADRKAHQAAYEARHEIHVAAVEETNQCLRALGSTQERAHREVILRMKAFLVRHNKQVRASEHLILDGIDGADQQVLGLAKLDADVAGWVRGVVGSTIAGVAAPIVMRTGVASFAAAGTGTAISGLGGAAATSATLAWLGGGSLAAGGGGMALGATMLNVAVIGPTALIAGLTVKNRGTREKSAAAAYQTQIEIGIAQLDARNGLLLAVQERVGEVDSILARLISESAAAIDLLESEPFEVERHAERFQKAVVLVKAVRDVATAPIIDEDVDLDERTSELVLKYREEDEVIRNDR
ncbi:hypothetical protein [Rathayibacter sp. AY1F6]|uniref:hypothetical protein n=1 Tax=Rathayibacter sp. AY1F6 TaxID=2080560 RepID=UPI0011B0906C|nr:hypothetical protein [Rathayibacter sp. AY1F6]